MLLISKKKDFCAKRLSKQQDITVKKVRCKNVIPWHLQSTGITTKSTIQATDESLERLFIRQRGLMVDLARTLSYGRVGLLRSKNMLLMITQKRRLYTN